MKKLFKSVFALAIMGLAFVSCNKADEAIPQDSEKGYKYTFSVVDDVLSTKATLGTSGVAWENGDRVGIFVPNFAGYASIDVNKTPKEVVLYSTSVIPSGSKAYAYYPYSADNTKDDGESAKIVFNSIQQGGSASSMPMAGIPFTVENEVAPKTNQNGLIKFLNLGSIIEFNVFSTKAEYQTETVKSIKLETSKGDYVSGITYLDLTTVDASDETTLEVNVLHSDDGSIEVKVNQDANVAASKGDATPIYMVLIPGNHLGSITVNTDQASYYWVFPEMTFKRNGLKHFNMDLNNATRGPLQEVVKTLPYEEPFTSNIGDFTINEVVSAPAIGDIWKWGGSSYGMKATASTGGSSAVNYASESWLISPWIDLTGGVQYAKVTFDHVQRFAGTASDELTFWVISNEIGDSWTQITIPTYSSGTNWTFVNSGEISLNSYIGKRVKVAFKYTSTTEHAATWEIKNFKAEVASEPQVATPVISFETATKTVTITCATPGAQIAYRLGGEDPVVDNSGPVAPTQGYTGPFTITATTTVKALAGGVSGYKTSEIASKECVVPTSYAFETIAQLNALATATSQSVYGYLTNAVVSFVPGTSDAVIKDATGSVLYHKTNHGLKQGQTYTGPITVDLIYYNSLYSDITSIDVSFVGDGAVVEPEVLTLAQLTGNYTKYQNTYAKLEDLDVVSVSGNNVNVTDGTNNYVVYTNKFTTTAVAGDKVTAVGTISKYGTAEQLKVWASGDLTVSHTATSHKVYINQPAEGGTIYAGYASNFSNQIHSGDEVMEGTVITIEATPSSGYKFVSWTLTGASPINDKQKTTSFTMGSSDVTISATIADEGAPDYPTLYSSNVELTTTNGTNAYTAKVKINSVDYDAIKVGKSSAGGEMKISVPAGTKKLHLHAAAWKDVTGLSLNITTGANGVTITPSSIALTADSGFTGNASTFTLTGTASNYYFVLTLSGITSSTTLTFTTASAKRFVIWGVNAE